MQDKKYSAGMVSKPFWYIEFKTIMELLAHGYSYDEIKEKAVTENLFGVPKEYRAREIFNGVSRRAKSLDAEAIKLFCAADLTAKKALALIAVLKTDRLFFEFLHEVYREKILLGLPSIESSDLNAFFGDKQARSETVAAWKEAEKQLRQLPCRFRPGFAGGRLVQNNPASFGQRREGISLRRRYATVPPRFDRR